MSGEKWADVEQVGGPVDEYVPDEAAEPKLNKLADMVDELAAEMKRQAEHNSPITPNMIKQIEAIQSLIYKP